MDPLTHLTVPAACHLAAKTPWRYALLAGVGGLLPDMEKGLQLVLTYVPGSHFMFFKHGGTHTVLGSVLLVWTASLFLKEDRAKGFIALLAGAWIHIVLDVVHLPWSVRPLRPFSAFVIPSKHPPWATPLQWVLLSASLVVIGWAVVAARRRREKPSSIE